MPMEESSSTTRISERTIYSGTPALRTNTITFLTAAAGAVLAIAFKDGVIRHDNWWIGIIILALGVTNLVIVEAHFRGNRFHTTLAGKTRRELEKPINWSVEKPTQIRTPVAKKFGLNPEANESIGSKTQAAIRWIPVGIILLGIATSAIAWTRPAVACAEFYI
jgi:hypothetical protein